MSVTYDVEFNSAAHYPAASVTELAKGAEAAGFGAFWAGESNNTDPLVVLSSIASHTSTIQLGTAILHIHGRSPVTLGVQAATLQDLSAGRLLLGLGVSNRTIASWHGGVFDRPLRRMREYVEAVRLVASGERAEYEGQAYTTGKGFKLAWKPEYPKIQVYLAALGQQMTRLVGKIGEGVMLNMATPDKIREIVAQVRAGAVEAGRDPECIEVITKVRVSIHRDRAIARQRMRQVLTFYNIAEFYSDLLVSQGFLQEVTAIRKAFQQGGFKAAIAQMTDDYMDRLPVVLGTSVKEVKEQLQPFVEAGVTRVIIPYVPTGDAVVKDGWSFLRAWEADH